MSDQKNWDAAMIKTWRNAGSLLAAMIAFKAISGKQADQCDPPLRRMPPLNFPWKVGIRVFVAKFLSKPIVEKIQQEGEDLNFLQNKCKKEQMS
jgi:hypothetical protein